MRFKHHFFSKWFLEKRESIEFPTGSRSKSVVFFKENEDKTDGCRPSIDRPPACGWRRPIGDQSELIRFAYSINLNHFIIAKYEDEESTKKSTGFHFEKKWINHKWTRSASFMMPMPIEAHFSFIQKVQSAEKSSDCWFVGQNFTRRIFNQVAFLWIDREIRSHPKMRNENERIRKRTHRRAEPERYRLHPHSDRVHGIDGRKNVAESDGIQRNLSIYISKDAHFSVCSNPRWRRQKTWPVRSSPDFGEFPLPWEVDFLRFLRFSANPQIWRHDSNPHHRVLCNGA